MMDPNGPNGAFARNSPDSYTSGFPLMMSSSGMGHPPQYEFRTLSPASFQTYESFMLPQQMVKYHVVIAPPLLLFTCICSAHSKNAVKWSPTSFVNVAWCNSNRWISNWIQSNDSWRIRNESGRLVHGRSNHFSCKHDARWGNCALGQLSPHWPKWHGTKWYWPKWHGTWSRPTSFSQSSITKFWRL